MTPQYIGFARVEEWARVLDTQRPVYACSIEEPGPIGPYNTSVNDLVVVLAQPDDRGDVLYCRRHVGAVSRVNGRDFDEDASGRRARATAAYRIVWEWLNQRRLNVREAVVAMPRDLRWMNGGAGFLRWDGDAKQFVRVPDEPASSER